MRGGEAVGHCHVVHHPEAYPEEGAAKDGLQAHALANLPQMIMSKAMIIFYFFLLDDLHKCILFQRECQETEETRRATGLDMMDTGRMAGTLSVLGRRSRP